MNYTITHETNVKRKKLEPCERVKKSFLPTTFYKRDIQIGVLILILYQKFIKN